MNRHYALVAARANHRCEYCHAPEAIFNFPFEVEHIVPPSRGGGETGDNLALACRSCNLFKASFTEAVDSETEIVAPLFHPRLHDWMEHFEVALGTGELTGLSPTARATIECLRMNSQVQRSARVQWAKLGLFP